MSQIDDFWPEALSQPIQSPLAVLSARAAELSSRTRGTLRGIVGSLQSAGERLAVHKFSAYSPALSYVQEILSVTHSTDRYYPCRVDAACFTDSRLVDRTSPLNLFGEHLENVAINDLALQLILKKAIQSAEISSLLFSLIAQSNEASKSTQERTAASANQVEK